MKLKLALVESCTDTDCRVQLFDDRKYVGVVYAQPMIDYGISVKPRDLVAVDVAVPPYRTVYRWEYATIHRVEGKEIFIHDGFSLSRTVHPSMDLDETLTINRGCFIVNNEIIVLAVDGWPTNPENFIKNRFPPIVQMYRNLGAERAWRKTFLQLENKPSPQLPAEFQHDDVRYPENLVEHFLHEFTQEGDVVFDPFAGYGTTLLVAERMGRITFGIEYDERRVEFVRTQLRQPDHLIHGDSRKLATYTLPPIDFSMTSPPYMGKSDPEDPFANYSRTGKGYDAYLADIQHIYSQLRAVMKPGAHAIIEVANLNRSEGVTTLAWDIAKTVSEVLYFEGEVIVGWDQYGYGYDHSYCLVFSNRSAATPTAPKQVVAQGYDQIMEQYAGWIQEAVTEERSAYVDMLFDALASEAEVLELGCAAGGLTTPQLAQRFKLTGVDISPKQIERVRQNIPNAHFVQADMTTLEFPPNSFDGVVALFSIIHVPRREHPALLRNIAKWLRPGGLFVATMGANGTEGGYEEDWLGAPMYWSHYDSATNIRLVEEAGLEIVKAQEETQEEFGDPVTFLWIVARKPR